MSSTRMKADRRRLGRFEGRRNRRRRAGASFHAAIKIGKFTG